jgi:phosphatidylglycerophosphate synthase
MGDDTETPGYEVRDRRPMKPRGWAVMHRLTDGTIRLGLSANAISVLSVVFAALGAAALVATSSTAGVTQRLLWFGGALGIELRALCNLLDGMVAVKTRSASPVGELYNEVPDRFSDILMLAGLGYAAGSTPTLGWMAAAAAVLVAYVRAQAAASGAGQDYCGPMAKPVRMQLVAIACLVYAIGPETNWTLDYTWVYTLTGGRLRITLAGAVLGFVVLGCVTTVIRRLVRASHRLRQGGA